MERRRTIRTACSRHKHQEWRIWWRRASLRGQWTCPRGPSPPEGRWTELASSDAVVRHRSGSWWRPLEARAPASRTRTRPVCTSRPPGIPAWRTDRRRRRRPASRWSCRHASSYRPTVDRPPWRRTFPRRTRFSCRPDPKRRPPGLLPAACSFTAPVTATVQLLHDICDQLINTNQYCRYPAHQTSGHKINWIKCRRLHRRRLTNCRKITNYSSCCFHRRCHYHIKWTLSCHCIINGLDANIIWITKILILIFGFLDVSLILSVNKSNYKTFNSNNFAQRLYLINFCLINNHKTSAAKVSNGIAVVLTKDHVDL